MSESEPITTEKFVKGAVQIKTGVKALAFLPWLCLWVALGWGIYITYIKPHVNPMATQDITVESGGMVIYKTQERTQKWHIFVEPFVEQSSGSEFKTGVRGGLRWEW